MNRFYETIGELKVQEICEHYELPRKERVTLRDVFVRLDAVERFLKTESDERILEAKEDIVIDALHKNPNARELFYAIIAIDDEFARIKDAVHQLKDIQQEGALLH